MSAENLHVPVLSVRGLSAHYGKVAALDPIDLTVGRGEIVTVIGANGAGKSTLLGAIMGALPLQGHSQGSILFQGAEVQGWDIERRVGQGMSLVPERRELFASMTVRDNLLLGGYGDEFTRAKRGTGTDPANRFLDHGNYLAYGLGATACWVLGLPHGLAVLHGKTRRGGLVFDVADLVKDACILPQAFLSAMRGDDEQQFRRNCIEALTRSESLDFMIDTVKEIARATARQAVPAASGQKGGA